MAEPGGVSAKALRICRRMVVDCPVARSRSDAEQALDWIAEEHGRARTRCEQIDSTVYERGRAHRHRGVRRGRQSSEHPRDRAQDLVAELDGGRGCRCVVDAGGRDGDPMDLTGFLTGMAGMAALVGTLGYLLDRRLLGCGGVLIGAATAVSNDLVVVEGGVSTLSWVLVVVLAMLLLVEVLRRVPGRLHDRPGAAPQVRTGRGAARADDRRPGCTQP